MAKLSNQIVLENRLRKHDSYTKEPFCVMCDCNKSVVKCKQKIENEANPCHRANYNLRYKQTRKAVPDIQEFDIEIVNERGETQFVKLDDKKSKGQLWFANTLDNATKFIERDTTVIIDYLLGERRKGNVKFKEITARPLNAWRKDNKKSKAIELNLSVVNGAVSILSTESVSGFVGGGKTVENEDNNTNAMQVAKGGKKKGNELAKMIKNVDNKLKPKLYVNGNSLNTKVTTTAPSETLLSLCRPFHNMEDMPFDYLFKRIQEWELSITECILEPIGVMDENNEPIMEEYQYMGETKQRPKIAYEKRYVNKDVPTLSGLAKAIGVSLDTFNKFIRNAKSSDNSNCVSNSKCYNTRTILTPDNTPMNSLLYQFYGNSIFSGNICEKDLCIEICKRARSEVDNFHEKRLGKNENVSGSMMYLFNSKALEDGGTWSNNHSVTVEAGQSILGRVLSGEELDRLAESSTADTAEVIEIEFKEDEESGK